MDPQRFFEPGLAGYIAYCVEFLIRYFLLAGGLYWALQVAFRKRWLSFRIQDTFPGRAEVRHEILWSMSNMACTGLATVLMYHLVRNGDASMYFDAGERGWAYFALSPLLVLAGYDTWIYWQHRWMHSDFMFRHVHWIHHRVGNPTPLATFAQHPLETFLGNAFFVLFVAYVPIHPLALAAAGGYMFLYGIIGHLGYEFFPRWFARNPLLGFVNTSTYHNMHHTHMRCNYAAWFLFWDRALGTNHPDYLDVYDEVTARRAPWREVLGLSPQPVADQRDADNGGFQLTSGECAAKVRNSPARS